MHDIEPSLVYLAPNIWLLPFIYSYVVSWAVSDSLLDFSSYVDLV